MEPEDDDLARRVKVLTDPRLTDIHREVVLEWTHEAAKRLPARPQAMSGLTIPVWQRLTRARRISTAVAIALSGAAACSLLIPFGRFGHLVATATWLTALSVAFLLVAEILVGAGAHVQTQYATAEGFRRKYAFVSSLHSPAEFIGAAVGIVGANLLGFASQYLALWRADSTAFTAPLEGIAPLYFSVVTFGTVGYGDIAPQSSIARALVLTQIVSAYAVGSIVLATMVAWLLSQRQRQMELAEESMRATVEYNEALAKEARIGLYDTSGALAVEVLKRAAERGISLTDSPAC